jgi:Protein involved in initiation of plasmid replication
MSFGNEKKIHGNLPVVIGKDLAQARFSMDLWERRLMYVCMSKLQPTDQKFPMVEFRVAEIAKLLGVDSLPGKDYASIQKAAKKLVTRIVEVKEKNRYEVYNWVSYFRLDKDTNEIAMQFNDHMKPHLLYLLENKGYTKFLLKFGMKLSGEYAQRIYEMFRGMVSETQPKAVQRVELQELRRRLDMPDQKLRTFGHFKTRVLDIAENDINQKSDIYISFKDIRKSSQGRPVVALHVSVILKTNMLHEWDKYMLWQKDDLLEKLYQMVERKDGQKLNLDQLEKYSHESIARLVYEIVEGKINMLEVRNHQGFIVWQLDQWQSDLGINQIRFEDL